MQLGALPSSHFYHPCPIVIPKDAVRDPLRTGSTQRLQETSPVVLHPSAGLGPRFYIASSSDISNATHGGLNIFSCGFSAWRTDHTSKH
eukprot:4909596-Pyramimonas_sp.AAC.1